MVTCAGCDRPIMDRFLLNVLDRAWHTSCVQCMDCKCHLSEKCFSRDGKLYCRNDFFRRYGTKCAGCSQGISPNDLVRRARNKVFHLKCFTCVVCRKQLSTGEELYVLDENKFICKEDYLSSKFPGSDVEDEMDLETALETHSTISDKDFGLDADNSQDSKDLLTSHSRNNDNNNTLTTNNNNVSPLCSTPPNLLGPNSIKEEPPGSPVPRNLTPNSGGGSGSSSNSSTPNSTSGHNMNTSINSNSVNNNSSSEGGGEGVNAVAGAGAGNTPGAKRRGPRTTIKAKQLETLKAAFAATPKPTRHIREQLAQETGLNMRVIQVWFQNRRSKERRMKQLSALGARRHFFRNPRRMRAIRAGMSPHEMEESPEMLGGPGFGYFGENGGDFYPGYQGYGDFFPGQGQPGDPGGMAFLPPPPHGTPPIDQSMHPSGMGPDVQYMQGDILPPSTPEPMPNMGPDPHFLHHRALGQPFNPVMSHPSEMTSDTW